MKRTAPTSSLTDKMLDLAAECFDAPTLNALAGLRLNPSWLRGWTGLPSGPMTAN